MYQKYADSRAHYSVSDAASGSVEGHADWVTVLRGVGEFFVLVAMAIVVPAMVYFDIAVLGNTVGEVSATEITQELLVFMTASIFWYKAYREPAARGFWVLVAGFFTCILIREMDFLLDGIVHGFWVWPGTLVAVVSIFLASVPFKGRVLQPMAAYVGTKPYFFMIVGLAVLLVFSRIFGSGNLLWERLLGAGYSANFKSALQEGLELLGYFLIGYSAVLSSRLVTRSTR